VPLEVGRRLPRLRPAPSAAPASTRAILCSSEGVSRPAPTSSSPSQAQATYRSADHPCHPRGRAGRPRIHGELLKLGFEVARSTVAKYMIKRDRSPGQSWRTFLCNHAPDIAFGLLYGFLIVRVGCRGLVWITVTSSPTAEWIARQITEAFPWDSAPGYLVRDRNRAFGSVVMQRRLRAMGIRNKPIAPRSPWQNGFAERLVGLFAGNDPFLDGNGRVARSTLMEQCIGSFGQVDMSRCDRGVDYYAALRAADRQDPEPLKALIERTVARLNNTRLDFAVS
jgi:transposase InsO family protein